MRLNLHKSSGIEPLTKHYKSLSYEILESTQIDYAENRPPKTNLVGCCASCARRSEVRSAVASPCRCARSFPKRPPSFTTVARPRPCPFPPFRLLRLENPFRKNRQHSPARVLHLATECIQPCEHARCLMSFLACVGFRSQVQPSARLSAQRL